MTTKELLSLPEIAKRLRMPYPKVLRLFERGLVPQAIKVGRMRVVAVEELPRLREAARAAGYL